MGTKTIADRIVKVFNQGGKLLVCGNGGSAAQAQHLVAELVCKFKYNRKALPALALTTDTSVITSIGNDIGFDEIFARQVEALGKKGDILLVLSTSGKSKNCIRAIEKAEEMELKTIELEREGTSASYTQELHLVDIHEICGLVEEKFI